MPQNDLWDRDAGALEAHRAHPPGRVVQLPASRPDPDELDAEPSPNVLSARAAADRLRDRCARLGLSQAEYRLRRAAGTLPAWCMERKKRSDAKQ